MVIQKEKSKLYLLQCKLELAFGRRQRWRLARELEFLLFFGMLWIGMVI